MAVTLALSVLCENPHRRTGLSTLFHEFVRHALNVRPDVRWLVFAGPEQEWRVEDERVTVVRDFPSNERLLGRLYADHFRVAAEARRRGAQALLTVGFSPMRTAGLPIVMHLFSLHHRNEGGLRAWYRRRAVEPGLRHAALVIVNSQWTASQLGGVRAPVLVSHEGLQHDRFTPSGPRGLSGWPAEYVLWAGNFYGYKRAELALAAYARLPNEIRARFPFVLVGGDWEGGRTRAEGAARTLGIEHDTRFVGWISDSELPVAYRGARAHVLSSAEETFGRSVAEAMACGCPCLVQDLPVLREVTAGAARLVDFGDTPAAAAALCELCTNDALAAQVRTKGVRRAAAFSFEKLARERLDAILAAVEKSA